MKKHFELIETDFIHLSQTVTLKRIRATVDSPVFSIRAGDIGGYVQSLSNLEGNAWVYGNARVYGNAQVYGDARVYGNAWIYGNAWVSGDAQASGDAQVYGDARVSGNAQVSGNAWIYGNAQVYGDARVSGNAQVSGNAWVSGNAQVSGNARVYAAGLVFTASNVGTENGTLTVHNSKEDSILVTRGCFLGTVEEFFAASRTKHDEQTQLEYLMLIEVATMRINKVRKLIKEALK